MTLNQIFNIFNKKFHDLGTYSKGLKLKTINFNPFIFFGFIILFSSFVFIFLNIVEKKNLENQNNLKTISKLNEFSNLINFFTSKINSPYKEINYFIQKNDSIRRF